MMSYVWSKGDMTITVKELTDKKEILDAARTTVWKGEADKKPSYAFLHKIYRSEHSPIRDRMFTITIEGIESWIATHFVRHHVGCTPYVSTQRDDRECFTGKRDAHALVNMRMTINAQSLIDMAQRRLCCMAHKETIAVMVAIKICVGKLDPHLAKCMVPQCVYRGFCPEGNPACYDGRRKERDRYLEYQCDDNYDY